MKHYRVFIHGKNFLLRFGGKPKKVGFYTTRVVEATDEKAAENAAVLTLRQRQSLRDVVLNDRTDPPLMFVEEITEVAISTEEAQRPEPGLVWYAEDGTDLTQIGRGDDLQPEEQGAKSGDQSQ